jgi:hypothetical protein
MALNENTFRESLNLCPCSFDTEAFPGIIEKAGKDANSGAAARDLIKLLLEFEFFMGNRFDDLYQM